MELQFKNRGELITAILDRMKLTGVDRDLTQRDLDRNTNEHLVAALKAMITRDELQASTDRLIQTQAANAANNALYQLRRQREQKEAEEKRLERNKQRDWDEFVKCSKKYRRWAINTANFNLLREDSRIGSPLTPDVLYRAFLLYEATDAKLFGLSTASTTELEAWAQEAAEARQSHLIHTASRDELRNTANYDSQQARAQAVAEEDRRQIAIREAKDAAHGFPRLPETNSDGIKLDSKFFVRASADTLRRYVRTFGAAQITAAIRTRI